MAGKYPDRTVLVGELVNAVVLFFFAAFILIAGGMTALNALTDWDWVREEVLPPMLVTAIVFAGGGYVWGAMVAHHALLQKWESAEAFIRAQAERSEGENGF